MIQTIRKFSTWLDAKWYRKWTYRFIVYTNWIILGLLVGIMLNPNIHFG